MGFAAKVARAADTVTAEDVQDLRDLGLSDRDVLDVAFAVGARCFFATVLDAVGAQADRELADALGQEVSALLTVGRPIAWPLTGRRGALPARERLPPHDRFDHAGRDRAEHRHEQHVGRGERGQLARHRRVGHGEPGDDDRELAAGDERGARAGPAELADALPAARPTTRWRAW